MGEVLEALLEDSSPDVSIMAEDDDRYLLSISYEDEGEVEDLVCTLAMLCYSKGVYHYSLHYIGREGGGVRRARRRRSK